ncbi:DUF2313 domain-containing protein [Aneurinibacillus thermoaerophilus]|uniref:DUF2313 domain-containing protein n=1 Tax=Aneurinibacillus thermoaerophilus TaxID=143495 RepID=A0A1G8ESJ7_ANETH|nr:DUF2313 domain-containing protein [Aneurinibacillus thermoaerophilus]MED0757421.1 DUF2313 domain-containing protein [Aneurinibacillus thermoaerophilus]MED0762609.1 DUF2313 domain-containing protein [Aneurinibacillus thermoaerophilus]SDH72853.1 hypothetical protein SAMN04489735_10483 [Aneurinibacillus thermoaerophilus]
MIPLRYREVLPPYWYENEMAETHFGTMEEVMDDRQKTIEELGNQFILRRATYGLDIWDWIYFRKKQPGSYEERREAIRKKKWAKRPFKLPVLRMLGAQHGKLLAVKEDFLAKEIHFEYAASQAIDLFRLHQDFEYIRPIHINRALPIAKTAEKPILIKGVAYQHSVDFPICGLEVPTTASVSGQIVSQGLSVSGTEYHHRVDAPITGFEVPMGEGE